MATTIQISDSLLKRLKELKLYEKESYEEVILDLIEDRMELSEETKNSIKDYENDLKKNSQKNFISLDNLKKGLS